MSKNEKKVKNNNTKNCDYCMKPAKNKCGRCNLVFYCGRKCQEIHWKKGHKHSCFSPEDRKASKQPDPRAAEESEKIDECCICLDLLSEGIQKLDCGHTFHKNCIDELRNKGVKKVCPLCRAKLPDTPEKMFADGCQLYYQITKDINNNSWSGLNKNQKIKINKVEELWTKSADQGLVEAQHYLGCIYDEGYVVAQDYSAAMKWYRMAADQGHASSQHNLGIMYEKGQGVAQDYSVAMKWFRMAADKGHADSQCNLGIIYEKGQGVAQDYSAAMKWHRMAAGQGLAEAQYNLGLLYMNGQGVPLDYAAAVNWCCKAAYQGHAPAQHNLGIMYLKGQGVSRNYSVAIKWIRMAADQGLVEAQHILRLIYSNGHGVAQHNSAVI